MECWARSSASSVSGRPNLAGDTKTTRVGFGRPQTAFGVPPRLNVNSSRIQSPPAELSVGRCEALLEKLDHKRRLHDGHEYRGDTRWSLPEDSVLFRVGNMRLRSKDSLLAAAAALVSRVHLNSDGSGGLVIEAEAGPVSDRRRGTRCVAAVSPFRVSRGVPLVREEGLSYGVAILARR